MVADTFQPLSAFHSGCKQLNCEDDQPNEPSMPSAICCGLPWGWAAGGAAGGAAALLGACRAAAAWAAAVRAAAALAAARAAAAARARAATACCAAATWAAACPASMAFSWRAGLASTACWAGAASRAGAAACWPANEAASAIFAVAGEPGHHTAAVPPATPATASAEPAAISVIFEMLRAGVRRLLWDKVNLWSGARAP